jgi:hypothetical protein
VSAPRLEPFARSVHPAETARLTADGRHCDHRGCREPIAVYAWYYPPQIRPAGHERFLCAEHGKAFARRQGLPIRPALEESELPPVRVQRPGAYLTGMGASQLQEHEAEGWHCDFPGCRQPARYRSSLRYEQAGRIRRQSRFLCIPHAEQFAARHGIDMAAVPPPEVPQ